MKSLSTLLLTATFGVAGERSSANYTITPDTADLGGQHATSAAYSHSGSAGATGGLSTAATPATTAKHGFIGQLFEIEGLELTASATNVNEGESVQLAAWLSLDDDTFNDVPAASVAWSVSSGPISGIDANGLATAGPVFDDSPATVQGLWGAFTGSIDLNVVDAIPDNFGAYAGDGLGDDWQVLNFGPDNPLAAPALDPDNDGQDNRFEFLAGVAPMDPNSRLDARSLSLTDSTMTIEISRVQPGTRYRFERSTDLLNWNTLLTLDPAAAASPFIQPVSVAGSSGLFRVTLEPAPSQP